MLCVLKYKYFIIKHIVSLPHSQLKSYSTQTHKKIIKMRISFISALCYETKLL